MFLTVPVVDFQNGLVIHGFPVNVSWMETKDIDRKMFKDGFWLGFRELTHVGNIYLSFILKFFAKAESSHEYLDTNDLFISVWKSIWLNPYTSAIGLWSTYFWKYLWKCGQISLLFF